MPLADVIFPGYPDVTTVAYIQPVLQGRTSLVFKTDSYSSFIKVFMTTDNQTEYSITGLPFLTYIYKYAYTHRNLLITVNRMKWSATLQVIF